MLIVDSSVIMVENCVRRLSETSHSMRDRLRIISIPIALGLGAEFMPRLNEGDLLVEAVRLPSASLEGAEQMAQLVETALVALPEIKTVFTKTGRPEIANDVMGVHQSDVWVMLHPPDQWPEPKTRDQLIGEMEAVLTQNVPGVAFGFTQPIENASR